MTSCKTAGLAVAAVLALLAFADDAFAFCRATTESPTADFNAAGGRCWTGGKPLYWKSKCVGFSLQKDGTSQFAIDKAAAILTTSFSTWAVPSCSAGGTPSLIVSAADRSTCGLVEFNVNGPNQNVIVFRDKDWPHNDPNNTLALTTLTFEKTTGEIYDADMEINTFGQTMTPGDPVPANGYDFESVVTHEAGHFMGLAHSFDTKATMYPRYVPGSTNLRNLTTDDVEGICTVYASDGNRSTSAGSLPAGACDTTPYGGFSALCGAETTTKKGSKSCSVIGVRSVPSDGFLAFGTILAATFLRRRRRVSACPRR
ncbi:MAG: matrixin family metalloprotease [Polyangiaceae bacterium]